MFAVFSLGPSEMTLLFFPVAVSLAVGLGLALFGAVAWQAKRRGYSFWVWMLASVVSLNPLLILLVLVMLPDARKKRLREKEMSNLRKKLAALPPVELGGDALAVSTASLGDQSTTAPSALRSIGDEETTGGSSEPRP